MKKIITKWVRPPLPTLSFDWCAYLDGTEEDGNYGWGRTEAEAISALNELIDARVSGPDPRD